MKYHSGTQYGDVLQQWLWAQLRNDFSGHLLLKPDETPPIFNFAITAFLNEGLLKGRIDCVEPGTMNPKHVTSQLLFLGFHKASCVHTVPRRLTRITLDTMPI
jgi:hypothetical protein